MKTWLIIHKGTGEAIAKCVAWSLEGAQAIIPQVAEYFDYAPYDLMVREES